MLTLERPEGFYTQPGLRLGMYARVLAAGIRDASGTLRCECGGTIKFGHEERTKLVFANCDRPGCFSVEG